MTEPKIVCAGCGAVTNNLFAPVCDECASKIDWMTGPTLGQGFGNEGVARAEVVPAVKPTAGARRINREYQPNRAMSIDLEAIKARSAADMQVIPTLELLAQHHPADEELRNAIAMIRDRHDLLEEVKRLRECLRGVASCGTCSAFRGAALLALEA